MIDGIGSSSFKPPPPKKSGTGSGASPAAKPPAQDEKNKTPIVMRPISEATAKKKDDDASSLPVQKDTTKPPPNNSTVYLPQNQPNTDKKTTPVITQTTPQKDTPNTPPSTSRVYLPLIQKSNDIKAAPTIPPPNNSTVYLPLIQAPSATPSSSAVVLSGDKQGTQPKKDDAKTANSPPPVVSSGASWPNLSQWGLTTAPQLDPSRPMGPSLPSTAVYEPQQPRIQIPSVQLSSTVPVINTGTPSLGMSSILNPTSTLVSSVSPILASSAPLELTPATTELTVATDNSENPPESIAATAIDEPLPGDFLVQAIKRPSYTDPLSITASNTTTTTATLGIPVVSVVPKVTASVAPDNAPNTPPNGGGWGLSMGGGGGKYPLAMITSPIVISKMLPTLLPALSSTANTLWSNWFGPSPSATKASPAGPAAPAGPVSAQTLVSNTIAAGEQAIDDAANPAPENPGIMSNVLNFGWIWSHVSTGNLMPVVDRVQAGITLNQALQNPDLSVEARAQLEKAQRLNSNPTQQEINSVAQWWSDTKDAHPWVGQTQAWLDQRWVDTKEVVVTGMLMNAQGQMIESTSMMALTGVQTEAEAEAQIQTVQTQTEAEIAAAKAKYDAQRQAVAYRPEVTTADAKEALNASGQQAQVLVTTIDQLTAQLQQQQQQLAAIPDPSARAHLRTQIAQTQQKLDAAQEALDTSPLYNGETANVLTQQASDANEARGDVVGGASTAGIVLACVVPGVNAVACLPAVTFGPAAGGQLVDEVNQAQGTPWEQAQKAGLNMAKGFASYVLTGGLAKFTGNGLATVTASPLVVGAANTTIDTTLGGKSFEQSLDQNMSYGPMAWNMALGWGLWRLNQPAKTSEAPATIPESRQLDVPGVLDAIKVVDPVTGKVTWQVPDIADPFTVHGTTGASPVTNSGASTALVPYGPPTPGTRLLTVRNVWQFPWTLGGPSAGGDHVPKLPKSPPGPTTGGASYVTSPDAGVPWWMPTSGNNPTGSSGAHPEPSNRGGGAPQMQTTDSVAPVMVADATAPQMQQMPWTLAPWAVDPQLVGDFTPINGAAQAEILSPVANPLRIENWVVGVDPLLAGQANLPALAPLTNPVPQPIRQPAALPASETAFGAEPTTVAVPVETFIPTENDLSDAQWMAQAQAPEQAQPQTHPVQEPVYYGSSKATQAIKDQSLAPTVKPVTTAPPVMVYDVLSSAPTTTTTAIANASSTNTATYSFPDIAVAQVAAPVTIPPIGMPNLANLTLPDWITGLWSTAIRSIPPQPAVATEAPVVASSPTVSTAPAAPAEVVVPTAAAAPAEPLSPSQPAPVATNNLVTLQPTLANTPLQAALTPAESPATGLGGGAPVAVQTPAPAPVVTAPSATPSRAEQPAVNQPAAPMTPSTSTAPSASPNPATQTLPVPAQTVWPSSLISAMLASPSVAQDIGMPVIPSPTLGDSLTPTISSPLTEGISPWQLSLLQLLLGRILIYLNQQLDSLAPQAAAATSSPGQNAGNGPGQIIINPPNPPFMTLPAGQSPLPPAWVPLPVPTEPATDKPNIPMMVAPQVSRPAPVNLGGAPVFPRLFPPQGSGSQLPVSHRPVTPSLRPLGGQPTQIDNDLSDDPLDNADTPNTNGTPGNGGAPHAQPNQPPSQGLPPYKPTAANTPAPGLPNHPNAASGRPPYYNPADNRPEAGSTPRSQPWPAAPTTNPQGLESPWNADTDSQDRYRWLVANQQVTQTRWVQFHTMVKGPNGQLRRVTTLRKITDNTRSVRASGAPLA
jgi:hypothetical protein